MNRKLSRINRNYIIIGLCMILVIMGVGYAAFSSQLNITGTSTIATDWNVKITNIQSKNLSGAAKDTSTPTYTETTATFSTSLTSPGDAMQYDITVENLGNVDAVLNEIQINDSNNPAITFETSGIEKGDTLLQKTEDVLTVIVRYDSNVTSQPEITTSNITVTLNYGQYSGGGSVPGENDQTIGGQNVEIVSSGDGLYEDTYEEGRFIYRGQNPNNYITFNDELWRIIAKEADGTYKIIRNEALPNRAFDEANHRSTENNSYCQNPEYGCGVYAKVDEEFSSPSGSQKGTVTEDSSIKIYLNDDYYTNNINETAKGQMISHSFNIGAVERLNNSGDSADSIAKNIEGEKMYIWTGNVGLANVSDILKASTNSLCTSATTSYNGFDACTSNYLLDKGAASELFYWTINAYSLESGGRSNGAWYGSVYSSYACVDYNNASNSSRTAPRPVVFLKSDITLTGEGTSDNPFTIM